MATISLCMIVKNEEAVLARCLDSIADLMDEIIMWIPVPRTTQRRSLQNIPVRSMILNGRAIFPRQEIFHFPRQIWITSIPPMRTRF